MEYQSFSSHHLNRIIRKNDFKGQPKTQQVAYREQLLCKAADSAKRCFSDISNPLVSFHLSGNTVFKMDAHHHQLIERKL